MSISQLKELEAYLSSQGVTCKMLGEKERQKAIAQWVSIFGDAFCEGRRFKEGVKACYALSQMEKGDFLLLSITNETHTWRSSQSDPRWGYDCKATGIPDLGRFCDLDFAMVASDYSWTMVYTHEDFALGGPFFVEKSWLDLPPFERKPERGHRKDRRWRH